MNNLELADANLSVIWRVSKFLARDLRTQSYLLYPYRKSRELCRWLLYSQHFVPTCHDYSGSVARTFFDMYQ